MKTAALLVMCLAGCTRQVAMGEVCEEAKQCGNGGDCYRGVCTPLCADDAECDGELVCARHHCLMATGEPRRAVKGREPGAEGRVPSAEGREPNAEGRLPSAEGREPNAEGRLPSTEGRPPRAELPTKVPGTSADEPPRPGLRNAPTDESTAGVSQQLRDLRNELESIRKEQARLREAIDALQKRP